MALDATPAAAHVTTPSGRVIGIPEGTRLVFGRGPDADLVIPAGRGLSRRAGAISASGGWFIQQGTALIGSRAMLDEGKPLRLVVVSRAAALSEAGADLRGDGDPTLLPLYLDPNTKLFLVALMWCRPW